MDAKFKFGDRKFQNLLHPEEINVKLPVFEALINRFVRLRLKVKGALRMKYPGWVLHVFPLLARSVRHIEKSRSGSNCVTKGGEELSFL